MCRIWGAEPIPARDVYRREAVGSFAAHGRFLEFLKKVLVKGKKLCYTVLDKIIYGVAIAEEIC